MTDRQVLALGFFDGIHLGHAALLRGTAALAAKLDAHGAVMTFDVHPDTLVNGQAVPLLNTNAERAALVRRVSGIEDVFLLPFTRETMRQPWDAFLAQLTAERRAAGYVVGHDFRFGYRGEGDAEKLAAWCGARGLVCRVIPPVRLDGVTVSSTLIRERLLRGDMAEANRLLGHPHLLTGEARGGVVPPAAGALLPRPGRYGADVTLSGGAPSPCELSCTPRGVVLPRPVSGPVQIEFTGLFTPED